MISTFEWLYFGGGTLLFFFWIYGIYAFVRDCRRTYIPGLRGWLAARRRDEPGELADDSRDEGVADHEESVAENEEPVADHEERTRQLY